MPVKKTTKRSASATSITDQRDSANSPQSQINAFDWDLSRYDPAATLIRINQVMALTGIGRATVYKLMNQSESGFPQAVKLTNSNARGAPVAWVLAEVLNWNRALIAARKEVAA
ncbi:AlpA family phage regulatory protein [Pseudomonas sp. SWRI99]|nr:AlpA family phage regulatory protein [Pseudomonas sp. SWRI99]